MSHQLEQFMALRQFLEDLQAIKKLTVTELNIAGDWFKRAMDKRGVPNRATIKDAAKKYARRI